MDKSSKMKRIDITIPKLHISQTKVDEKEKLIREYYTLRHLNMFFGNRYRLNESTKHMNNQLINNLKTKF